MAEKQQTIELLEFNPQEPIIITDKTGRKHMLTVDDWEDDFKVESVENMLDKYLNKAKKGMMPLGTDMKKLDKELREGLLDKRILENKETNEITPKGIKNVEALERWAGKNRDLVLEIADNSIGCFKRGEQTFENPFVNLETAEDDRVIGIPHTMATAGDKIYIINGRVMTGWSMYFSLTAIKSPEDYTKNVDLIYNVPYMFASTLLKAQLGTGAKMKIGFGKEDDEEIPEEKFVDKLLFKKLKINRRRRIKTSFHKYAYGNAYWHIRRNEDSLPEKITILQPERIKIFLDPMTTKVLFYIYLPPIIGGTVLTPYPDTKQNPNLIHNLALTYPTPIIIRPEDIIHFKQNDFTEYPFGFSDVKACLDPAKARLDINILAPIIFKKYAKPMVHWKLNTKAEDGRPPLLPKQVNSKISNMITELQNLEPGSDPVTTDRWDSIVLNAPTGQGELLVLTSDLDQQIFAVNGVPETYFKPKGSTDRMIAEQDKTFMGRLEGDREDFAEEVWEKLIKQPIDKMIELDKIQNVNEEGTVVDAAEEFIQKRGSFMADEPRYPDIDWEEVIKQDETQEIANTVALLSAGVISRGRAAKRVDEEPPEEGEDAELDAALNNQTVEGLSTDALLKGGLSVNKSFRAAMPGAAAGPKSVR